MQNQDYHQSPELDAHLGVWQGVYNYFNPEGILIKTHKSRLSLKRDVNRWIQSNIYTYSDGKEENLAFEGTISLDGKLEYDVGRVNGESWGTHKGICILHFTFKGKNDNNKEMVTLLSPTKRMRSWHLSEDGIATGFVQIVEERVVEEKVSDKIE